MVPRTALFPTFFRISSFVFNRTKTFIQILNYLRVSKWWQNFHFWVNYPFKSGFVVSWGIFVAKAKNTRYGSIFLMPKIISVLSKDHSMKIFVNISKCSNNHCWELRIWTTLKAIFSIFRFFWHPQIPDFQIVVFSQTIHQWKAYLFSYQMMYKSQFWEIDT